MQSTTKVKMVENYYTAGNCDVEPGRIKQIKGQILMKKRTHSHLYYSQIIILSSSLTIIENIALFKKIKSPNHIRILEL